MGDNTRYTSEKFDRTEFQHVNAAFPRSFDPIESTLSKFVFYDKNAGLEAVVLPLHAVLDRNKKGFDVIILAHDRVKEAVKDGSYSKYNISRDNRKDEVVKFLAWLFDDLDRFAIEGGQHA